MLTGGKGLPDLEFIRGLYQRDNRDKTGLFLVEGVRFLVSAINVDAEILCLILCPELAISSFAQRLITRKKEKGIPVLYVNETQFREISYHKEPQQGVMAVLKQKWVPLPNYRRIRKHMWLAAEKIHSSGNLGTIIRTAQASGCRGFILFGNEIDPYDPLVVRSTMGAIFYQKFVRCHKQAFLQWKKRTGCRVIGACCQADKDFRTFPFDGLTVLMIGNERKGLSELQNDCCDEWVRIPMKGGIDSLNLGVAAGILLFEFYNQRHPTGYTRVSKG
jgi:TrmH family RNA methyltransferase